MNAILFATRDQILSVVHTLKESMEEHKNDLPFVLLCKSTIAWMDKHKSTGIPIHKLHGFIRSILDVNHFEAWQYMDQVVSADGDQVIIGSQGWEAYSFNRF